MGELLTDWITTNWFARSLRLQDILSKYLPVLVVVVKLTVKLLLLLFLFLFFIFWISIHFWRTYIYSQREIERHTHSVFEERKIQEAYITITILQWVVESVCVCICVYDNLRGCKFFFSCLSHNLLLFSVCRERKRQKPHTHFTSFQPTKKKICVTGQAKERNRLANTSENHFGGGCNRAKLEICARFLLLLLLKFLFDQKKLL